MKTEVSPRFGRRRHVLDPDALPDLTGRTFAVTGGNAGIGYFITEYLAAAGAEVVILGRTPDRTRAAIVAIREHVPSAALSEIVVDLADLTSVAHAGEALGKLARLDGLIHNAGISNAGRTRRTSPQGFELTFATNHLGHFALTALAFPALAATPGSRVVPVGSIMTKRATFDPEDLQTERSYTHQRAYTQSKHAVQMFGVELDRRLRAAGVDMRAVVAHPGLAVDGGSPRRTGVHEPSAFSRLSALLLAPIAQSKQRGAWSALRAATDPAAVGGQYYGPARGLLPGGVGSPRPGSLPDVDRDPAVAARLWILSEELTGVTFDPAAVRS